MWKTLPEEQKQKYQRMILTFASLTELFSQKSQEGDDILPAPIINSKFQETIFQKSFGATAEDIGNTSYDAAIRMTSKNGQQHKFLVGIKTFGFDSGFQKIAQFKAYFSKYQEVLNQIRTNAEEKTKEEIDQINNNLYLMLAKALGKLRNERIDSSIANLKGFKADINDELIESVYHVLMPSRKGVNPPYIKVGETPYDKINLDSIQIEGCTSKKTPANFIFNDGKYRYEFTAADSQLLMSFNNKDIDLETWEVKYSDDAYKIFEKIALSIEEEKESKEYVFNPFSSEMSVATIEPEYGAKTISKYGSIPIVESYSWILTNRNGDVEPYSGFNNFFGVGSKLGKDTREDRINKIYSKYRGVVERDILENVRSQLYTFLMINASTTKQKKEKEVLRNCIIGQLKASKCADFQSEVLKLIFRPMDEVYIPIPNARAFHDAHPDFFGKGIGTFFPGTSHLRLSSSEREFNLVFEPSGDSIRSYITQDNGKGIESAEKQSYLGKWILRGIFQLKPYQQLTSERLNEMGINGIRLYKTSGSSDIHLKFIWIDKDNPPVDCIKC